jgi:hypothetical protein
MAAAYGVRQPTRRRRVRGLAEGRAERRWDSTGLGTTATAVTYRHITGALRRDVANRFPGCGKDPGIHRVLSSVAADKGFEPLRAFTQHAFQLDTRTCVDIQGRSNQPNSASMLDMYRRERRWMRLSAVNLALMQSAAESSVGVHASADCMAARKFTLMLVMRVSAVAGLCPAVWTAQPTTVKLFKTRRTSQRRIPFLPLAGAGWAVRAALSGGYRLRPGWLSASRRIRLAAARYLQQAGRLACGGRVHRRARFSLPRLAAYRKHAGGREHGLDAGSDGSDGS